MSTILLATLLCWFQPTGDVAPSGFALTVAGVPVEAALSDEGDMTLAGVPGRKWCAQVAIEWDVAALAPEAEVPSSNGPKLIKLCAPDFNLNGAVDFGDVSYVLSRLGEGCEQ